MRTGKLRLNRLFGPFSFFLPLNHLNDDGKNLEFKNEPTLQNRR